MQEEEGKIQRCHASHARVQHAITRVIFVEVSIIRERDCGVGSVLDQQLYDIRLSIQYRGGQGRKGFTQRVMIQFEL